MIITDQRYTKHIGLLPAQSKVSILLLYSGREKGLPGGIYLVLMTAGETELVRRPGWVVIWGSIVVQNLLYVPRRHAACMWIAACCVGSQVGAEGLPVLVLYRN